MNIVGTVNKIAQDINQKTGRATTILVLNVEVPRWERGRGTFMADAILAFKCFGRVAHSVSDAKPGSRVEVDYHAESREWNGRFFTEAVAHLVTPARQETKQEFDAGDPEAPDW